MLAADPVSSALLEIVGCAGLVTEPADRTPFLAEWRGAFASEARYIVCPETTDQVSAVVRLCQRHGIAIVPQGGNTGLCGGAVSGADQLLLSLRRMRGIRDLSAEDNTATVEAGCTLMEVQQAAADIERFFPLSLSAEGSCQIGGNLSTGAGGVNVLKYGGARDQLLGLEVVLPDGQIFHGLNRLRKNTAGYDLKQLFVGAEGTLGIITAATLKLYPAVQAREVLWLAVPDVGAALKLYTAARAAFSNTIAAFELIPEIAVEFVIRHMPDTRRPLDNAHEWHVLMEIHGGLAEVSRESIEVFIEQQIEAGSVADGVVAESASQRAALWAVRHHISDAQRPEGLSLKHDIALPQSRLAAFIGQTSAALLAECPGLRIVCFGHIGDGNLHFNLSQPAQLPAADFRRQATALSAIVHDATLASSGTISAEHGIGLVKRDLLERQVGSSAMTLMRTIKASLDPQCIMNPGKVL